MEHADTLLTIAELAVALAGFASLVSVIGGGRSDASRDFASLRLRLMLEVCFRNAAFALLPLPFLPLAPADPMIWRASSGLYVVVTIAHSLVSRRRVTSAGELRLAVSTAILLFVTVLVGVANVLGMGGPNAFSLYLANLLLGLGAAGLSFLSVADSVFRIERG